ncbi:PAS domain-containing protein [Sphingorhabdus sp.]|uniref:PAS domain-containing protein n=1 Tax=Sphingorhabdus sp. TaxID=1902408 RepID=UPI00391C04BA
MSKSDSVATFRGDHPSAATYQHLADRREIALVAMERTRTPMVVTDARLPDNPIILANRAFIDLTGYSSDEIIGQNCRFLQGENTLRADVAKIHDALCRGDDCIEIELLNYRKDGTPFVNSLIISAIRGDDGELLYHFASQEDVTLKHRARELEASERRLLMEVDHRTLNALTLIQSIVRLSRAENAERLSHSINSRIHALSLTHRLLAERRWQSVSLTELIEQQLAAHEVTDSVIVDATAAELAPEIVQPLGLVIHELVANARIHGALAAGAGMIELKCAIEEEALVINWREPARFVDPAKLKGGFGLQMVQAVIEHQLGGRLNFHVSQNLLEATIVVPHAVAQAD